MAKTTSIETTEQRRARGRAEYQAETAGLIFSKDFQSRQDAVIHDTLATVGERYMAWILRYSWGEYSLYAIAPDGEPLHQRDFCALTGIEKQRVSAAHAYYKQRGYLRDSSKLLYPVISPRLQPPPEKVTRSADFLQFVENWKVTHSADFEALEVARSTVKKIRQVLLSDYKKSRQLETIENTTLLRDLLDPRETAKRAGDRVSEPPPAKTPPVDDLGEVAPIEEYGPPDQDDSAPDNANPTEPKPAGILHEAIARWQADYPNSSFGRERFTALGKVDRVFLTGLLDRLQLDGLTRPSDETYEFVGFVQERFREGRTPGTPAGPDSLGLLWLWAEDFTAGREQRWQQRREDEEQERYRLQREREQDQAREAETRLEIETRAAWADLDPADKAARMAAARARLKADARFLQMNDHQRAQWASGAAYQILKKEIAEAAARAAERKQAS